MYVLQEKASDTNYYYLNIYIVKIIYNYEKIIKTNNHSFKLITGEKTIAKIKKYYALADDRTRNLYGS
jgi:hypothetical protein